MLYIGNDTKIMQNSKKAPRKVSNMMKMMNNILYSVFAFQIAIVIVFSGLSLNWTSVNSEGHEYLDKRPKEIKDS